MGFLISKGAEVNVRNNRGETPLGVALTAIFGSPNSDAVKVLQAHGATK